jgi:sulfatase modifying factor 1
MPAWRFVRRLSCPRFDRIIRNLAVWRGKKMLDWLDVRAIFRAFCVRALEDAGMVGRMARLFRFALTVFGLIAAMGRLQAQEASLSHAKPASVKNAIGMSLVRIPAGEFLMGGQEPAERLRAAFPEVPRRPDYFDSEYPQHHVSISHDFWMGQYEVTVGQFRRFVEEADFRTEAERDGTGGWGYEAATGKCVGRRPQFNWRETGFPQTDDHPVVNVTFSDAIAFCNWLGKKEGKRYRLPSEAEWEYACRAGTNFRFYHGDDPKELPKYAFVINVPGQDNFANVQDQVHFLNAGETLTAKVGSRLPNAWGLYDMLGNVWEWTNDWESDDYYASSPAVDPLGPGEGTARVRRGGGWNSFPIYTRPAFRNLDPPFSRCANFGFRVVCDD